MSAHQYVSNTTNIFGKKCVHKILFHIIQNIYICIYIFPYGLKWESFKWVKLYHKTKPDLSNLFRGKFHSKCLNTSFSWQETLTDWPLVPRYIQICRRYFFLKKQKETDRHCFACLVHTDQNRFSHWYHLQSFMQCWCIP